MTLITMITNTAAAIRRRRAIRAGNTLGRYYAWTVRTHRRRERKEIARMVQKLIEKGGK